MSARLQKHGENEPEEARAGLIRELLHFFDKEGFQVLAASGIAGYSEPPAFPNDGYGDQGSKTPDIFAYDGNKKCFVIGLVVTEGEDLESETLLTKYNVFLDQKDTRTGVPHRLYIITPPSLSNDLTAFLTHYIHPEYWHKMVIVCSKQPAP